MARQVDAEPPDGLEVGGTKAEWRLGHIPSRRYPSPGNREGLSVDLGPFSEYARESMSEWPLAVFANRASSDPFLALSGEKLAEVAAQSGRSEDYVIAARCLVRSHLRGCLRVLAGGYVVGRGFEPWWYQVVIQYDDTIVRLTDAELAQRVQVSALHRERPQVAVEFVPIDE
jgi:hypothetical protein